MTLSDSASEVGFIKAAIEQVGPDSGIDVRVGTTNNGVGNPGIMQFHAGVASKPRDPQGSIIQMVRDGTKGISSGDGLKQLYAQYNNYYEAYRAYNSGSVTYKFITTICKDMLVKRMLRVVVQLFS